MRSRHVAFLGVLLIALASSLGLAAGQGGQQAPLPPSHPPMGSQDKPQGPLPPGHPPMGGQGAQPSIPEPPKESGTGAQGIVWMVPSGWTKETPSSSMRRAQYRIQGPGGPAECVVFYFGPGQGGDADANAQRWASQFTRPDGSPAGKDLKTRKLKVSNMPVLMVEVAGTYVGGMGGGPSGPEQKNAMLLGAIVEGPDANWFFRAIGPKSTLEKERAAFEKMVRSIKRGQGSA